MDKFYTEVKVVRNKDGLSLVEWWIMGKGFRSWVPHTAVIVEGRRHMVYKPEAGVPGSQDFAKMLTVSVTPDEIDAQLKRHGIWDIDDLRAKPNSALGALQSAFGIDLASLHTAAKNYEAAIKNAKVEDDASVP